MGCAYSICPNRIVDFPATSDHNLGLSSHPWLASGISTSLDNRRAKSWFFPSVLVHPRIPLILVLSLDLSPSSHPFNPGSNHNILDNFQQTAWNTR